MAFIVPLANVERRQVGEQYTVRGATLMCDTNVTVLGRDKPVLDALATVDVAADGADDSAQQGLVSSPG